MKPCFDGYTNQFGELKHGMKRVLIYFVLILTVFQPMVVFCEPAGAFCNAAVFVNGDFFYGAPLFRTDGGDWYIPLKEISAQAGLEEPVIEDGFIDWMGFWMDTGSEDFFFYKDILYAVSALLEDAGLEIRDGELWGSPAMWISERSNMDNSWVENTTLIAHAMGAIDGAVYTNSLEAFQENYAKGFSVFEVDFQMSADGFPVAVHEWNQFAEFIGVDKEEFSVPTRAEFKAKRILGEYMPLDFEDIVNLMVQYPDIRIITDMKNTTPENARSMFSAFLEISSAIDSSVLNRIVPQIYSNEMLDVIFKIYPWKSAIYTTYQLPYHASVSQAFQYGYKRGIRIFTTPSWTWSGELEMLVKLSGSRLFIHTINNAYDYRSMKEEKSLWGIYTDTLTPLEMDGVEGWMNE